MDMPKLIKTMNKRDQLKQQLHETSSTFKLQLDRQGKNINYLESALLETESTLMQNSNSKGSKKAEAKTEEQVAKLEEMLAMSQQENMTLKALMSDQSK